MQQKSDQFNRISPMCADPNHLPPQMISIPAGVVYKHVCPSCGNVIFVGDSDNDKPLEAQ